jgi:hypothetical protein
MPAAASALEMTLFQPLDKGFLSHEACFGYYRYPAGRLHSQEAIGRYVAVTFEARAQPRASQRGFGNLSATYECH